VGAFNDAMVLVVILGRGRGKGRGPDLKRTGCHVEEEKRSEERRGREDSKRYKGGDQRFLEGKLPFFNEWGKEGVPKKKKAGHTGLEGEESSCL